MPEEKETEVKDPKEAKPEKNEGDQVALELMKFITVTTGYGKNAPAAGFTGKTSAARTPEEQAESLLDLFQRCRRAVKQPVE
jgi:hypothetical protein